MSPVLVVIAVAVVGGAIVAASARDARAALLGLVLVFVGAPLLADPIPAPLPLAARLVAAVLAGYLAWATLRATPSVTRGSVLGWPVEALVAGAAGIAGFATAGLGADPLGPPEAQAAGVALVALSVSPVVYGRDTFRLGTGLALLLIGALLVRVGLAGTPGPLEQIVTGGATIGLGGALALLCASAVAATGGFDLPERRLPAAFASTERRRAEAAPTTAGTEEATRHESGTAR